MLTAMLASGVVALALAVPGGSADEGLSLLQHQVRAHHHARVRVQNTVVATSKSNASSGDTCECFGDVHCRGTFGHNDVQVPGLWNALTNMDGTEVVQEYQCWLMDNYAAGASTGHGNCVKLDDFYACVVPVDFSKVSKNYGCEPTGLAESFGYEPTKDCGCEGRSKMVDGVSVDGNPSGTCSMRMWNQAASQMGCIVGIGGKRRPFADCQGTFQSAGGEITISTTGAGYKGFKCIHVDRPATGFQLRVCADDEEAQMPFTITMNNVDNSLYNMCGRGGIAESGNFGGRAEGYEVGTDTLKEKFCGVGLQAVDDPATNCYEASLFDLVDGNLHAEYCAYCGWSMPIWAGGPNPPKTCDDFVAPPPALTIPQRCEANEGCKYSDAEAACARFENEVDILEECLFDYCTLKCDPAIVDSYIREDNIDHPIPACGDGVCEIPPTRICKTSVKASIDEVKENTIDDDGGKILYGNVATVNGRSLDLEVVKQDGLEIGKAGVSGADKGFGVLNLKCGMSGDLVFTVKDSETGEPVTLDKFAISFYDVDEGKNGNGRTTIETCGVTELITTAGTELINSHVDGCAKIESSTAGTGKDNPENPFKLTDQQRARVATMYMENAATFTSTVSLAKPSKKKCSQRNLLFSLTPIAACPSSADLVAMGIQEPVDGQAASTNFCDVNGCGKREGCCMAEDGAVLKAFTEPTNKMRDSCLKYGVDFAHNFRWCTRANSEYVAKGKPLDEADADPAAYLRAQGVIA